jgi:hypothetical protein
MGETDPSQRRQPPNVRSLLPAEDNQAQGAATAGVTDRPARGRLQDPEFPAPVSWRPRAVGFRGKPRISTSDPSLRHWRRQRDEPLFERRPHGRVRCQ